MYDSQYIQMSNLSERIIRGELTLEQQQKTEEQLQKGFFSRKQAVEEVKSSVAPEQEEAPEDINDVMMDYMIAFRQGNMDLSSGLETPDVGQDTYTSTEGPRAPLPNSKVDYGRIAKGIKEAADALGVDPVHLATVISYETGGTFNPTQKGPTTQWGQHKGLIQFGEPQARENGVDWSDPYGSQLGANGAIVKYFKRAGLKPGMGLLDMYSTVNAGAPGLYNRSDANNGGAPGTVRDKVENQMAGHAAKARTLIGDYL